MKSQQVGLLSCVWGGQGNSLSDESAKLMRLPLWSAKGGDYQPVSQAEALVSC